MDTNNRRPDGTQPGDDRLMMESPHFWSKRPLLLLKRKSKDGGMPDTAILFEDDLADTICFRLVEGIFGFVELEQLLAAPEITIDKVLADGWIVD